MKTWDISRTLSDEIAPWPGDEPFRFKLTRTIAEGASVNLGAISMSVHNGTHADAQFHFDPAGATIERARLETYFGRAVVVDLTAQFSSGQKEFIEIDHLQAQTEEIGESTRLLIKTGVWKDSTVFPAQIPVLAAGVAPWLRQSGVKLLGLDVPSVDAIDAKILTNHHALAAAEIAIIESLDLTGVEAGVYNFMALPLKIRGSDGAPVRAVLWRD